MVVRRNTKKQPISISLVAVLLLTVFSNKCSGQEDESTTESDMESTTEDNFETSTLDLEDISTTTTTTVKPVKAGRAVKKAQKPRGRRIMGRTMKQEPVIEELDETLGAYEAIKGRSIIGKPKKSNEPAKAGRSVQQEKVKNGPKPRGRRIMGRAMKEEPVIELDETLGAGHHQISKGRGMQSGKPKKAEKPVKSKDGRKIEGSKLNQSSKGRTVDGDPKSGPILKLLEFLQTNFDFFTKAIKLMFKAFDKPDGGDKYGNKDFGKWRHGHGHGGMHGHNHNDGDDEPDPFDAIMASGTKPSNAAAFAAFNSPAHIHHIGGLGNGPGYNPDEWEVVKTAYSEAEKDPSKLTFGPDRISYEDSKNTGPSGSAADDDGWVTAAEDGGEEQSTPDKDKDDESKNSDGGEEQTTPANDKDEKVAGEETSDKEKKDEAKPPEKTGWREDNLKKHNEYRAKHASPPLVLDDELNASAQKCADHLGEKQIMKHICREVFGHNYGENLASCYGSDPIQCAKNAIEMWYTDEEPLYKYEGGGFGMSTGHFTQVVWKASQKLGLGFANNGDFSIVVGHYDPPGNYKSRFAENVLDPNNLPEEDEMDEETATEAPPQEDEERFDGTNEKEEKSFEEAMAKAKTNATSTSTGTKAKGRTSKTDPKKDKKSGGPKTKKPWHK